jgi:hypothetical protein
VRRFTKNVGKVQLEGGLGTAGSLEKSKFVETGQKNGSGQLIREPVIRAFASYGRRFVVVRWPLPNSFIVGVPFYDVSFRAFTASPTVLKGTPTAQPFDNRSIA